MSLAKNQEEVLDKILSDDDALSDSSSLGSDSEIEEDEEEEEKNEDDIERENSDKEDSDNENEESDNDDENIVTPNYLDDSDIEEDVNEDFTEEISDDEDNHQKLEEYFVVNDLEKQHPEIKSINFDEVSALTRIVRNQYGNIIDPLHTTIPFITKYEKARIIGGRAEQIDRGSSIYVDVESHVINSRTIAQIEFEQKKLPFIIARPLPNKSVEYWKVGDLESL